MEQENPALNAVHECGSGQTRAVAVSGRAISESAQHLKEVASVLRMELEISGAGAAIAA